MGFEIPDLNEVEERQFGGLPSQGWHDVEIMTVTPGKSDAGNNWLRFDFAGDTASCFEIVTITARSLPNVKAKLLILGTDIPAGAFKIEPDSYVGRKLQVLIAHEPYFDTKENKQKMGVRVKQWAKPGTHKTGQYATPGPNISGAPEGWGTQGVDDDIPF
jgi:hypothetical protein